MNADGSQPRNLTNSIFLENFPAWSPDGQWIAFSRSTEPPDNNEIFVMTATGGQVTRLTYNPAYDAWPVWLPPWKVADDLCHNSGICARWKALFHRCS